MAKAVSEKKFVLAYWAGSSDDEDKLKAETQATIRCFPTEYQKESGKCIVTGNEKARLALIAKSY